jgi:hypothetical protein
MGRAIMIGLYRPYVARVDDDTPPAESWRLLALQRAKSSAANINSFLNKTISSQTIDICHPMM